MDSQELIVKALKGRSVNSVAKDWGIAQPTLSRYVSGERLPDFDTALRMATEAGVDKATAFEVFAQAEREHKVRNFKLKKQQGFVQTDLLFILGGGWIVAIVSILCQMTDL